MSENLAEYHKVALKLVAHLGLTSFRPRAWLAASKMLHGKATHGYTDSWTYLAQAANGYDLGLSPTGYCVKSAEAFCVVGIFKRPLTSDLAVHLINPIGTRAAALIMKLCLRIREISSCQIYVKKGEDDLLADLETTGKFLWNESLAWHQLASQEDDTFPELLLDVDHSLSLFEVGRLHQARDKFVRFLNRNQTKEISWVHLEEKRYDDARRIVERFFSYKEEGDIDISKPCDYENMLVQPGAGINSVSLLRQLCCIDGNACAFLVMEQIGNSNVVGLYCNLALYQEHKYLSEFVIQHALKEAKDRGFRYLNLGGSEGEGLNSFKCKFQPIDQRKRSWLVFNGNNSSGKT